MVLDQVCASCGSGRLADGGFCLFCGDLLGDSTQHTARSKLQRAHASAAIANVQYAGFWRRFWAGCIDIALEATSALLLTIAIDFLLRRFGGIFGIDRWNSAVFTGMAYILIWAVGSWLYCAFAESSSWRATMGKRIMGLQVITTEGARVSFGQATVRHFMKFLSFFCLTIGFLMSGWTRRRQALHDMPCDVLVIRTPAAIVPSSSR
jgi:uncharacterized RDD family membrane protein YckC